MSFAFARKTVAGVWILAVAGSTLASAQTTNFTAQSGEFALSGALLGDQVHPSLAVNERGGYVVWQDNATDGDGLGIRGRPLDSTLSPVSTPFRVNQQGAGDQENPRVALLKDGGAVFVWQGGRQSFQHIYARFLSSSNTWLTGDVLVNTFTNNFQNNPAVTVLTNGNVVIVWASEGQQGANSMLDVYGQLFTPAGQRIYPVEFPANQFTLYNQRTPAVAALKNGGFVVTWVSEQERALANTNAVPVPPSHLSYPSVDIYARLYDSGGSPTINEFLVNTHSNVCANPSVACAGDGSFLVAWSEKDIQIVHNSWDVYAARCTVSSPSLVAVGPQEYLNTQLYGDQYGPRVSALGTNYLAVWTSLGQDGSLEGVYGQFLDEDGAHVADEFRVNTTTVRRQRWPVVAADNYGRFLVAWSSFGGWPNGIDLYAQRYARPGFVSPPYAADYGSPQFVPGGSDTNTPPPTGGGTDTGGGGSTNSAGGVPVLSVPDSFAPTGTVQPPNFWSGAGFYSGLFCDTNGASVSSAGYFMAKATPRGTYSAKIILAGRKYPFSGRFDSTTGGSTNFNWRTGLTLVLQLDSAGGEMTGQILGNGWTAQLVALQSASAVMPGNYTMQIPGDAASAGTPAGTGYGTIRINAGGKLNWKGQLADGTRVSEGSTLSAQGYWPLYASLYRGSGVILSWVHFTNDVLVGQAVWIKPAGAPSMNYLGGFTNVIQVSGSRYPLSYSGARAAGLASPILTLSGGGLGTELKYTLQFGPGNRVTVASGGKLKLKINRASGLLSGKAFPDAGRPFSFKGVLLENTGIGAGFFLNGGQSGAVYLNQVP